MGFVRLSKGQLRGKVKGGHAKGRSATGREPQNRMRKVFHFDSAAEPYVADAAVLCCFDHRISLATRKFLRKQGIVRPDMIVVAGGAKTLASPRNDFERDFILEQVRMSIRLHRTARVFLMSHSDCATYGGLAAFDGRRGQGSSPPPA